MTLEDSAFPMYLYRHKSCAHSHSCIKRDGPMPRGGAQGSLFELRSLAKLLCIFTKGLKHVSRAVDSELHFVV